MMNLDDSIDFLPEELSNEMHNLFALSLAKTMATELNHPWTIHNEDKLEKSIAEVDILTKKLGVNVIEMKITDKDNNIERKFLPASDLRKLVI